MDWYVVEGKSTSITSLSTTSSGEHKTKTLIEFNVYYLILLE